MKVNLRFWTKYYENACQKKTDQKKNFPDFSAHRRNLANLIFAQQNSLKCNLVKNHEIPHTHQDNGIVHVYWGGTAVTYFGTFILFLLQRRLRGGGLLRFHLLAGGEHFRGLLLVFFCVAVGQFSLLWRHKRIKCDSRTWTPPCTVLSHRFAQHDKSGGSSEWTGRLWHLGGRCLTQAGFPP